jgi:glycosyltransferase involved in cell wall biosynthesis
MWTRSKALKRDADSASATAAERPSPVSILLLTEQFLPIIGGTELTTLREAKALQARGHPVRVLTWRHDRHWPGTEEIEGVFVRRTGGLTHRGRLRVRFGATWLAEARVWYELVRTRHSYDVVQLRQLGRLARPAVLASFVTGKPLVVRIASAPAPQVHGGSCLGPSLDGESTKAPNAYLRTRGLIPDAGDVDTLRRVQYLAPLTLRLLRAPQVTLLATSTRIREHLVESWFGADQIVLLPNGVDPRIYQDAAACRARRPPTAPGDIMTIACPARLSYQKGQDVLLQAWRTVQERVPAARLILAGDGHHRLQLERQATDLGISHSVVFAGLVGDVQALLATAHGFVLPSRYEGMPNALLEAMAAGLPCVATRVSGSEDLVVDGQSGLLVPPEDPEALARALVTILTNHQHARSLGYAARVRVLGAFDQRRVMDELSQLYASLVSKGDTRRRRAHGRSTASRRLRSAESASTVFVEDEVRLSPSGPRPTPK